jgi:hypothetical protein
MHYLLAGQRRSYLRDGEDGEMWLGKEGFLCIELVYVYFFFAPDCRQSCI